MTVEEYAAACEELSDKFDDDSIRQFDSMEVLMSELKRWNPPEELQEFHETRIRSMEVTKNALKDTGFLELIEDLEKASEEDDQVKLLRLQSEMADIEDKMSEFEDEISELQAEAERTQDALSPATLQILADANCL